MQVLSFVTVWIVHLHCQSATLYLQTIIYLVPAVRSVLHRQSCVSVVGEWCGDSWHEEAWGMTGNWSACSRLPMHSFPDTYRNVSSSFMPHTVITLINNSAYAMILCTYRRLTCPGWCSRCVEDMSDSSQKRDPSRARWHLEPLDLWRHALLLLVLHHYFPHYDIHTQYYTTCCTWCARILEARNILRLNYAYVCM